VASVNHQWRINGVIDRDLMSDLEWTERISSRTRQTQNIFRNADVGSNAKILGKTDFVHSPSFQMPFNLF
jgi:hypothetical protein